MKSLIVLSLCLLPAFASAQVVQEKVLSWDIDVCAPGAAPASCTSVLPTKNVPIASATCGLVRTAPPPAAPVVTAALELFADDPADRTKDCRLNLAGASSFLFQLAAAAGYVAVATENGDQGTRVRGAASNPFNRQVVQTVPGTGLRVK